MFGVEANMKTIYLLFIIILNSSIVYCKDEVDINKLVGKKYEEFRDQQIIKKTWKIKDKKNIKELILDTAIKFRKKEKEKDTISVLSGRAIIYCPNVYFVENASNFEKALLYLEYIEFELPIYFNLDEKEKYNLIKHNLSNAYYLYNIIGSSEKEKLLLEPCILANYDKYDELCDLEWFFFEFRNLKDSIENKDIFKKVSPQKAHIIFMKMINYNIIFFDKSLRIHNDNSLFDVGNIHFDFLNFCYLYLEFSNDEAKCIVMEQKFLENIDSFRVAGYFIDQLKISKKERELFLPGSNKGKANRSVSLKEMKNSLKSKNFYHLNELTKAKLGVEIMIEVLKEKKIDINETHKKIHQDLINKLESYKEITPDEYKSIIASINIKLGFQPNVK